VVVGKHRSRFRERQHRLKFDAINLNQAIAQAQLRQLGIIEYLGIKLGLPESVTRACSTR
jgi:hypothetical protein